MGSGTDKSGSGVTIGTDAKTLSRIKELELLVARMRLANQSMWELLRGQLKLSDNELRDKMHEVDLRDGVVNGRLSDSGLECPNCERTSNAKHGKCLYCGHALERKEIF